MMLPHGLDAWPAVQRACSFRARISIPRQIHPSVDPHPWYVKPSIEVNQVAFERAIPELTSAKGSNHRWSNADMSYDLFWKARA